MLFKNVAIESVAYVLPPVRVTSAELEDRIAPTMERLGVPMGRIVDLAGIQERRFWESGAKPSDVATLSARAAIAQAGIDSQQIGAIINTSITRDYIEPSTACLVHGNLELSANCINYDVTNACLGFMSGMMNIALLIDAGAIDYGLVVNGDTAGDIVEATMQRLQDPNCDMQTFRDNFATLTIGSNSVAMVLGRKDRSKHGHSVNGVVTMADPTSNRLCVADPTMMKTDASALLVAGVKLAAATWHKAQGEFADWSDENIVQYCPHQVGSRHNAAVAQTLGLTPAKMFTNYPTLGNIGPAAVPVSLAQALEAGRITSGDRVALFGIGSGINCSLMDVTW